MSNTYINLGTENIDLSQFKNKVKNYDIELTRKDVLHVISEAKENSPSDIPEILGTIKDAYGISIAI